MVQLKTIKITEARKNEFFYVAGLGLLFGIWVTKFGLDTAYIFFFLAFAVKASKSLAKKMTSLTMRWLDENFFKV